MPVRMLIKGLMMDPVTNMPILVLRDDAGERTLPIWIGMFEAHAVALQLENSGSPRAHDARPAQAPPRGAGRHRHPRCTSPTSATAPSTR